MRKEGVSKGWKITAIVFLILFILETMFVFWMFSAGTKMIKNENICAVNICSDDKYTAYFYDEYSEICYCYEGSDITFQQVITGGVIQLK